MSCALAATPVYPVIQVNSSTTNMKPGETGYITISLSNDGAQPAYSTEISFTRLDEPLSSSRVCTNCMVYSTTRKFCLNYAQECYYQMGDVYGNDAKDITYEISIPVNISTGYYLAEFLIRYISYNSTSSTELTKYVYKHEILRIENNEIKPDLIINKAVTNPEVINPGQKFNATLSIENSGSFNASNTKVRINSTSFSTYSAPNIASIGNLSISEVKEVLFELVSDKSLLPGVHAIAINLTYDKDSDNHYSLLGDFGVIVGGNSTFEVFIQDIDPELIVNGTDTAVILSIANTGIMDADSVSIKLHSSQDIALKNVREDYIGDLDSGDFTSSSFSFIPEKQGSIELIFELSYTNQLGERINYNFTESIYLGYAPVMDASGIRFAWLPEWLLGNSGAIILIAVIVMLLYFFLKSKRKRK